MWYWRVTYYDVHGNNGELKSTDGYDSSELALSSYLASRPRIASRLIELECREVKAVRIVFESDQNSPR